MDVAATTCAASRRARRIVSSGLSCVTRSRGDRRFVYRSFIGTYGTLIGPT